MKNALLLLIVSLSLFSVSCKKDEGCTDSSSLTYNSEAVNDDGSCIFPVFEKKALVFKTTSQDCSYCGDWGVTYSTDLHNDFPDMEIIDLHSGDYFKSNVVSELVKDLGYSGTPHFFVGPEGMTNNYMVISNRVRQELQKTPDVAIAITHRIGGNNMTIDVQTKKSSNLTGEYYLAVYILEDGQVGYQQGIGGSTIKDFEHNHVMRLEASGEIYGVPIKYEGENSLNHFSVTLRADYPRTGYEMVPGKCYPVAVIWKKTTTGFEFMNVKK